MLQYPSWALTLPVHKQVLLHFFCLNGEQLEITQNYS